MPGQCLGDVPEGSVHIKPFLSSLLQRHIFHDVHSLLIAVVSLNDPWVRMVMSMSRVVKHQQTCTKDSPRATIGEVNSCGFATVLRVHFRFNRPPLCNLFLLALQIVLACCHRCLNEFITVEAMICGTVEEDLWLQHMSHCHL